MASHAKLSPSSAVRWFECPGSIELIENTQDLSPEGHWAAEGTILHGIMEECLTKNLDPYSFEGRVIPIGAYRDWDEDGGELPTEFELEITEDLCDMLAEGLDEIDTIPGKMYVEKRVSLDRWVPGQFGTLDLGIIGKKRVTIWDHKFGMVPVPAVRNKQIRIYALGFWENIVRHVAPDITEFRLIIWQPRCHAGDGGGVWDVTLDELLDFGEELKEKGRAAKRRNAPRIPGPAQCQYCPGAKNLSCKEYVDYNTNLMMQQFDSIDELDEDIEMGIPPRLTMKGITPEQRSYLLEHRKMIEKFFDRLHAQALEDALKGEPTPGMKAVHGRRPPRKWKDADVAGPALDRLLQEDAWKRKLITPTQAEELLSAAMYSKVADNYVDRGEPKPILVPEEDGRPPIPSIKQLFDELDAEDEEGED